MSSLAACRKFANMALTCRCCQNLYVLWIRRVAGVEAGNSITLTSIFFCRKNSLSFKSQEHKEHSRFSNRHINVTHPVPTPAFFSLSLLNSFLMERYVQCTYISRLLSFIIYLRLSRTSFFYSYAEMPN